MHATRTAPARLRAPAIAEGYRRTPRARVNRLTRASAAPFYTPATDYVAQKKMLEVGVRTPPLGLGLAALGRPGYINIGHDADIKGKSVDEMRAHAHETLDAAWAMGVRYFDCARSYGASEEFLSSWLQSRNIPNDKCVVGSKCLQVVSLVLKKLLLDALREHVLGNGGDDVLRVVLLGVDPPHSLVERQCVATGQLIDLHHRLAHGGRVLLDHLNAHRIVENSARHLAVTTHRTEHGTRAERMGTKERASREACEHCLEEKDEERRVLTVCVAPC